MVLWDIVQQMQIRQLRTSQMMGDREGHFRDQRIDGRADELEDRIGQLVLITEAVWKICRDQLGLTDEQLRTAVEAVIAEHTADAAAGPIKCTSCEAAIPKDMVRCQFCGADTGKQPELFK